MTDALLIEKIKNLKLQYSKITNLQSKKRMEEYIAVLEKELEERKKDTLK